MANGAGSRSGLRLTSRTSVEHFRGSPATVSAIADSLAARYVLEGSGRRAVDSVRVTVQLIDAAEHVIRLPPARGLMIFDRLPFPEPVEVLMNKLPVYSSFKRLIPAAALFLALILVACGPEQAETPAIDARPQAERMADVDLIPRDVFFGNPDKVGPDLSPDGTRLAYLAPVEGALNVWVGPAGDPSAAVPMTRDDDPIFQYWFAYDNQHLLYLQDEKGDENDHVYAVNLETGATTDLTPIDGVAAQLEAVGHRHPGHILVGLNDRDPQYHDLYRIEIATGARELVQRNDGYAGFLTDDEYNVRFAIRFLPDGTLEMMERSESGEWQLWTEIPDEDNLATNPIGFDRAGTRLQMQDSRGRNTAAVYEIDLATGGSELISENARADAGIILRHPTERNIQAVSYTYERREWDILDPALRDDIAALDELNDGDWNVISRTLDDRKWVVAFVESDGPVPYYVWDRDRKEGTFLFTNRDELTQVTLAPMHPEVIEARDGLNLVSYLTLPVGSDPNGDGRPDEALPMVLLVHGGPWGRDNWGYNGLHQFLANRGYAVLSVNFRGSTGLGKEFTNAGDLEWGAAMHEDLIDAVEWAIAEQIADRDRVAIMGGSYGGYATLVGLTMTPDVFAAGVDIVGPSNLNTLLSTIPPYWEPIMNLFRTRVGDPDTPEGQALLTARSPLTYVDSIRRPLLIGQGANDPRVKQSESDQIVDAMTAKGIPVTYTLFPDEGHGFARPENSLAFFAVSEVFLAEHLGGRHQWIADGDFEGSTIQVPVGAADVPGLEAAIPE
jgi:dipeptidyl aminopeptidase/acylaminoacyl peptidase